MFHITMSYRTSQRTFFPFALLLAICHVEAAYLDGIAMLNFLIYYDTRMNPVNRRFTRKMTNHHIHPKIYRKLLTLQEVGLGYVKIGQPATTLSGGEAQRVKLAAELSKRSTGKTIYVLDEPTTGLHTADVHKLLEVLERLTDGGNTVLVIEHNLDVIKTADYLIDLGPEGGDKGGTLVCCGTPEEVAVCDKSYTGRYLKPMLSK